MRSNRLLQEHQTDLTVFGPEVKSDQEEGGELRLVETELVSLQLTDVLFQDTHQRPQLALHRITANHKVKKQRRWFVGTKWMSHLLLGDHVVVTLGDSGQEDPRGQLGGEGGPDGREARGQPRGRGGGGRGLSQLGQPTNLQKGRLLAAAL